MIFLPVTPFCFSRSMEVFCHRWLEDTLCLCVSSSMSLAYAQSGIISLHVGYGGVIPQREEMGRDELVLGMLAQTQMDLIEA